MEVKTKHKQLSHTMSYHVILILVYCNQKTTGIAQHQVHNKTNILVHKKSFGFEEAYNIQKFCTYNLECLSVTMYDIELYGESKAPMPSTCHTSFVLYSTIPWFEGFAIQG